MNERTKEKYNSEVRDNMEMVVPNTSISNNDISYGYRRFRRAVGIISITNWIILLARSIGWSDGYKPEVQEGRVVEKGSDKRLINFLSGGTFLLLVIIFLLLFSIFLTIMQPGGLL